MSPPSPTLIPITIDNPCIICPDGTDAAVFAPYADDGDLRTCADLIDEAKLYETGSDDCGWFEFSELLCFHYTRDSSQHLY